MEDGPQESNIRVSVLTVGQAVTEFVELCGVHVPIPDRPPAFAQDANGQDYVIVASHSELAVETQLDKGGV